ncbi:MAG: hypothetical protein U1F41_08295 [Burkholderiales bacterium]
MTAHRLHGRCHCGNVAFVLDWTGDPAKIPARACGCTFCVKHGGVWTSHPGARLAVTIADPSHVTRYQFGTRTAVFHICTRCGVPTFVTCAIEGRTYAVVNVNCLEDVDASRLDRAPARFDGEDVDARLARRKRGWIADVVFG